GFGRDPNDLINAFGPTATNSTHSVKLSSTYQAPLDFNLGLRYSYESGRPYGRLIIVRGLGQGQVTMLAEPRGAYTLPSVNEFQVSDTSDTSDTRRILRDASTQALWLCRDSRNRDPWRARCFLAGTRGRKAVLRRRQGVHPIFSGRSDHARQRQEPADRLAPSRPRREVDAG